MQCYFCTSIIFYSICTRFLLCYFRAVPPTVLLYCSMDYITSSVDSSGTKLICRIKIKKSDRSLSIVSSENCHQKVRLVHADLLFAFK